jgi:hypothetical protein
MAPTVMNFGVGVLALLSLIKPVFTAPQQATVSTTSPETPVSTAPEKEESPGYSCIWDQGESDTHVERAIY